MITVATDDFEVYHEVVTDLRERGVTVRTIEPGAQYPEKTDVVVTAEGEAATLTPPADAVVVEATPGRPRPAIEEAIAVMRGKSGRTVVGIDPGERPGIAVLVGDMVVAVFQVSPEKVPAIVHEETADAADPLVRIGDGARIIGARIVDDLDVPVELVDETGTTPYLGAGTRGVADVLAAVNIARIEGERIETRDVEPTEGELQRIQKRSREQSETNREIDADLARRVAAGDLTIPEALEKHRRQG